MSRSTSPDPAPAPGRTLAPTRGRTRSLAVAVVLVALAMPLAVGAATTPATGAAAAGPAADPVIAPVQARPADSLVDAFGVNTHLTYTGPYQDTARVSQALSDLGVRHVRDNLNLSSPESFPAMRQVASTGVRFNLIMGRPRSWQTPSLLVQTLAAELPTGVVESLEGANEYNLFAGAVDWVTELRTHQQQLWEAAKAEPTTAQLPVLAPALGMKTGFEQLADLGRYADYGNAHLYPGGRQPSYLIDQMTLAEQVVVPGKPVVYTEGGYHNATNTTSGHRPTPEAVVGSYAPRMLLEHFVRGTQRFYQYELLDQRPDVDQVDHEARFGLLRHDFTPKPAYTAMKNLLALAADPGPAFAAGQLRYRVDGAPAGTRQVLLQKRDGEFVLLLWRDVAIFNPTTGQPVPVSPATVNLVLGERSTVAVHRPSTGSAAVSTTTGTSVPVVLTGDVVAVRITLAPAAQATARVSRGPSRR
ncbi:hypothetical protein [Nocardioides sp.]|uniref:hypothetical protein n=1 Tax=Nocardioides sp. TaxID=35761 RepID=UPI001A2708FA|nr:hypothetical protein [Nocardioides sp.]MBJ7357705.1 hypothetical protein [Nocardioides sp.]